MDATLFQKAVAVAEDYLGPSAERFMASQIRFHLGKKPDEITADDLTSLEEWLKIALALLADDPAMVESFTGRMRQLS